MEEKRTCTHCGKVLSEDEGTLVNEELLCDECLDDCCITCDNCGETIWTEDCVTDDNTYLCQDCFDNNYNRCERCGRIIREYDTSWHNDLPYCYSCYDEIDNDDEIEEYSYKPEPLFRGAGKRFFGIELEVDEAARIAITYTESKILQMHSWKTSTSSQTVLLMMALK